MSSVACAPTMCAPRISPYFASRMIFTKPSVSPDARAAVGAVRELAHLVVDLLFLHLRFGHADRGDLGVAVRRVRNIAVAQRVERLPGDDFGDDHALALALVREHRRAGDVADRVEPLRARFHALVDLDEAAVGELKAGFLEPDVLDVRGTGRGDEHAIG